MTTKLIIATILLISIPFTLVLIILWYPVAALLRFAEWDVPYPHEHMQEFLKGEVIHAH